MPPLLEPYPQELLGGEMPSLVGAEVEDRLPPLPMSMSKDLEPSSPVPHGVDSVEHQKCPDAALVGGTCEGPQP